LGTMKKWHELQGDVESLRDWPVEIVYPGGGWLPPAERCPTMQQWHGARKMSSGKFRPREFADCGRNWPPPEWRWPAVQEWHGPRDTGVRNETGTMWNEDPQKDKRTKGREGTVEEPGMQQWHKGPRPQTAATRQQVNKGPRWQTAAIFEGGQDYCERHQRVEPRTAITPGKWRNAQKGPIWDFLREKGKANSRILRRVTKNQGLYIVEGLAPSKTVEEPLECLA
jgi:hypothetical protein